MKRKNLTMAETAAEDLLVWKTMLSSAEDILGNFDARMAPITAEIKKWSEREQHLCERYHRASDDIRKYGKLVEDAMKAPANTRLIVRQPRRKESMSDKLTRLKAEVAALTQELGL